MANKKRLIDANELAETYCEIDAKFNGELWILDDILAFLDEAPTVDAAEVVHGRWDVEVGMNYNKERICPVCNKHIESNYWNYCPNCGAKMDGDGNG